MLPTLKGLPKLKTLKRLPGLGKTVKQEPLPDLDSGPERIASLVDDELTRLTQALGDERLAKRIIKLRLVYPEGTLPELVAIDWLQKRNIKFEAQYWVLGGREIRGGQVLDVVVDMGTGVIIIEVQGNYWHTRPGNATRDEGQRLALLGLRIWGKKVSYVVEVWESRLVTDVPSKRDQAMTLALSGIEVGA